ncbi:MAG TPA: hypothetical protein DCS93_19845 [Microscillaceae bacterium]|nr:hypothetical protein [Microscillaceae bacterium]
MNHTIIYPDCILFWGTNTRDITHHQHPAVQLVAGIEQSFLTKNEAGDWVECPNILVAPNQAHQCDASHMTIFSLMIDQESILGEHILQTHLQEKPWLTYPEEALNALHLSSIFQYIDQQNWVAIYQQVIHFFGIHQSSTFKDAHRDDRITKVLSYVKTHLQQEITTHTLTEVACLSESRLLHLFKTQVGLPIRNYILWLRIKTAVELIIAQQYKLTQIAYEAGFADAAHMSRTFNKVLGVSPSMIAKNSKFVQVSLPEVL